VPQVGFGRFALATLAIGALLDDRTDLWIRSEYCRRWILIVATISPPDTIRRGITFTQPDRPARDALIATCLPGLTCSYGIGCKGCFLLVREGERLPHRKPNPDVLMMQPAHDRNRDDFIRRERRLESSGMIRDLRCSFLKHRRVWFHRQVNAHRCLPPSLGTVSPELRVG
jgi:hypothetical protein